MRIEIDKSKLERIKQHITHHINRYYGFNAAQQIYINMSTIIKLYVEDLLNTKKAKMECRPLAKEIIVDEQFVNFNANNQVIGFKPHLEKLIVSQLGHELLHAASSSPEYNGIIRKKTNNRNSGLNEGITQLFTEDIFGYVVSPFSDSYTNLKKIAKIIALTIGKQHVFNNYFLHTEDIKQEYEKIAGKNTYEDLNQLMDSLRILLRYKKAKEKSKTTTDELYKNLYLQKIDLLYEKILLDMVIPKMQTLNEKEKEEYIRKILIFASDSKEIENKITKLLSTLLPLNEKQLEEQREKLKIKLNSLNEKNKFIDLLTNGTQLPKLIVYRTGEIKHILDNKKEITLVNDHQLATKIYATLYKLSIKDHQKNDKEMQDYLRKIQRGEIITFNQTDDVLEKRKKLSYLKEYAASQNIIILNDYTECDQLNYIKVDYITKNHLFSFSNLQKILSQFQTKDNYIIRENITVKDSYLIDCTNFANLWVSVSTQDNQTNTTNAFTEEHKKIYYAIMTKCKKNLIETGDLNILSLLEEAKASNNTMYINIVKNLFSTSEKYDIVYKYIEQHCINHTLQQERENIFNPELDQKQTKQNVETIIQSGRKK